MIWRFSKAIYKRQRPTQKRGLEQNTHKFNLIMQKNEQVKSQATSAPEDTPGLEGRAWKKNRSFPKLPMQLGRPM